MTFGGVSFNRVVAPARGRIVSVWIRCGSGAVGGGTAFAQPQVNGSVSTPSTGNLSSTAGTATGQSTAGVAFNAGDTIGLVLTSDASWSPATNDITGGIFVIFD
jgi:hypothetical protein